MQLKEQAEFLVWHSLPLQAGLETLFLDFPCPPKRARFHLPAVRPGFLSDAIHTHRLSDLIKTGVIFLQSPRSLYTIDDDPAGLDYVSATANQQGLGSLTSKSVIRFSH